MAGMLNQPMQVQAPQVAAQPAQPQMLPTFPVQAMPFDMGQGYGAARFLTGDAMIPLNFNVPSQEFTPPQFTPGNFASFMEAQRTLPSIFGSKKTISVPVYNPSTGTYTSVTAPK